MEVRCEGVRLRRDGRDVLDVPSLVLGGGRTTAVFGPNGAGKTSLLRVVGALERPAAGRVLLDGRPARADRATRMRVAHAFQDAVFLGGTVRANLALGLRLRGIGSAEQEARIAEAAAECGIAALLDRAATRLSGGEAQRANLARALCLRAPLTLLDEPLTGLDPAARARLLGDLPRLLRTFAATTVVVTHDRDEALRLADDLVVLVDGRVRAAGPTAAVAAHPPDVETAALLGWTILPAGDGVVAVPPGALRPDGGGAFRFELTVERTLDLGHAREALGRIGDVAVAVALGPDAAPPTPGARLAVTAATGLRLPATSWRSPPASR
jgi:ABC-type sulfate/molybdate transport systems ATPase subunit